MSQKNSWALTPVKRSHLVSTNGVGSLIRLRNGATGLVAGLRTWVQTIPVPAGDQFAQNTARQAFLKQYEIRDPELESACGVSKFYQPPRASEDDRNTFEWQIPVIVFPRSAICENFRCGTINNKMTDTGLEAECELCDPVSSGRRKRRYRQKQAPIFLVCPDGHIDEIKWDAGFEHGDNCTGGPLRASLTGSIRSPRVQCPGCEKVAGLPKSHPCTGARPWIPGIANENCQQEMFVVDRTSVQTYYPQNKTSIHVPAKSGIDNAIIDWILIDNSYDFIDPNNDAHIGALNNRLTAAGFLVDSASTKLHIEHVKIVTAIDYAPDDWDFLKARAHELDILTSLNPQFVNPDSKFLEFHNANISTLDPELFGAKGLFEQVVAVTRLTETRVQDGFVRWKPVEITSDAGHMLLWGHHRSADTWLPAYRAHGEGILFVLNSNRIAKWAALFGIQDPMNNLGEPRALSYPGVLAHSLAHLIMTRLSHDCGYPLPSISDRVYDLPDGRHAFLVYTSESDIMGTLGGLVEFGEGPKLEELVRESLQDALWCSQDPVCIGRVVDSSTKRAACCHKCLYLPETSCEWMNTYLDRATIIGNSDRRLTGITQI